MMQEKPDDLTHRLVAHAYAQFCAEHRVEPSPLAAKRFVVEVTESGARPYHGLDSGRLERLLSQEFGEPR